MSKYFAAKQADVSRVRNFYILGQAKVQYIELQFQGYNKHLGNALAALGAMDGKTDGPVIRKEAPVASVPAKRVASRAESILDATPMQAKRSRVSF